MLPHHLASTTGLSILFLASVLNTIVSVTAWGWDRSPILQMGKMRFEWSGHLVKPKCKPGLQPNVSFFYHTSLRSLESEVTNRGACWQLPWGLSPGKQAGLCRGAGPALGPFPIEQVAGGSKGPGSSKPWPVQMSLEGCTKESSKMAQPSKHRVCHVACSADTSRPQAEYLIPTGVTAWPHSMLPPGPCGGALDWRVSGFQASVTWGDGCRKLVFAPPLHFVSASPPHAAPTPAIPDPSCTACATLGCAAPSSPQFPVARGQLGLWRVRVWCCSAICGRSGNNLKLNPQLFGSLLWNHCKFINNSCGHTWPGSQPQPHPPNCRREAAVDLQFSVTFLRGEKLHEEKSPPSLHGHRKLAVGEWATSPGDQKCWRKQAQKAVKKLHKNSHVLSAQTSILGTFRLRLATVVNVWLVETSFSPWTICSFSSFIFSCPDPATWAELCGFVV